MKTSETTARETLEAIMVFIPSWDEHITVAANLLMRGIVSRGSCSPIYDKLNIVLNQMANVRLAATNVLTSPTPSPTPDLSARIEAAAEEIATKADEGWPALRCDKCGSLELIRNVPEDGYDCRGCSNFTRTPDEVIGITKIDLEKLATAIIRRHLEVK